MGKNKNLLIVLALVLVIGFVAYKKLAPSNSETTVGTTTEENQPNLAETDGLEGNEANTEDEELNQGAAAEGDAEAEVDSADEEVSDGDFKDQINKAIASQITADYADLFTTLNLAPEKKTELENYFVENKQLQQDLIMMLMDEHKSIDEIVAKQETLSGDQSKKLEKILTPEQVAQLNEYNTKLPEKNLVKQIDSVLEGVEIPADKSQEIKNIFLEEELKDYKDGKSLNMVQSKHTLDFKPDQLKMFREIMSGSQNNDPTAIKANLKYEEQRMDRILARLPESFRQAIKEKLEVSLNIQRNVIKMMENQSDS